MAINWSTVPLIGCLLTVLIEWQVAARLKIIFLGEQLLSLLVSSPVFSPELGLFSTDVVTDWVNGYNLYQDGHVIWGSLTAALPFLPIAIGLLFMAFVSFKDDGPCRTFLILLFFVPGVLICTPLYMLYVLVIGFVKVWKPEQKDDLPCCCIKIDDIFLTFLPPILRMAEVVAESYPQSVLGRFLLNDEINLTDHSSL